MKDKKIIIAGGTGFIGQAMARYFGKDNHVIILSRQTINSRNNSYNQKLLRTEDGYNVTYWRWDGQHVEKHWALELEGADIVVNLAGKSVNCRYNAKNRKEIFDSRVDATRVIGEAIQRSVQPPKVWINAASATIYRHAEDLPQDEYSNSFGNDFSVQVCQLWEETFYDQRTPFTRKVALRMAVTLGSEGVMIPYLNLVKFGLGGRQGNGRQMFSWVHVEDVCRAVEWCYDHTEMEGTYNCAAPNPVTNEFFMRSLRMATAHKIGLPALKWMLSVGAQVIGTETELILKSRWVLPAKLLKTGFKFRFALVKDALTDIISIAPRKQYHLF